MPSYLDDSDEQGSPAPSGREDDFDREEEEEEEEEIEPEQEESEDSEEEYRRAYDDRSGRKPSVVSVSTTISTKTECISPQQTPDHRHSTANQGSNAEAYMAAALARLGKPPMLRSLLLLAEMSSVGNLMTGDYTSQCLIEARKFPEFVMGFIAQRSLNEKPNDNFVTMTPGVQIGSTGDGLGQQYNTPEKVIQDAGTDVIIVGRGIYGVQDRRSAAEEYRKRAWAAYEARIAPGAKKASF